jgi:hypothetical protein
MAAAIIMNTNTNSFPVALLRVLAVSMPGLKRGQDDTVDAIVGHALPHLLLYSTMANGAVCEVLSYEIVSK